MSAWQRRETLVAKIPELVDEQPRDLTKGPTMAAVQASLSGPPATFQFQGTLEQLSEACALAQPGTVLDLGGATITSNGVAAALDELLPDHQAPPPLCTATLYAPSPPSSPLSMLPARPPTPDSIASSPGYSHRLAAAAAHPLASPQLSVHSADASVWGSESVPHCAPAPARSASGAAAGRQLERWFDATPSDGGEGGSIISFSSHNTTRAGGASGESVKTRSLSTFARSFAGSRASSFSSRRSIAVDALVRTRTSTTFARDVCDLSLRDSCEFDSRALADRLNPHPDVAVQPFIDLPGYGVTLRNGTLALPPGYLLLCQGCDLALDDVTVTGSSAPCEDGKTLPLVYVSRATVRMKGCTVAGNAAGHGLGLGASAIVGMAGCAVRGHKTCGAVLRGDGCLLTAHATQFDGNGQDGVTVSCGAFAELTDCRFADNANLGLGLSHRDSAVRAAGCAAAGNRGHGFAVFGGAALDLASCTVEGNQVGLLVLDGGTSVAARACTFRANDKGIHLCAGATVTVADSTLQDHSVGVCAAQAGSEVTLTSCTVTGCREAGLDVSTGAHAAVTGGRLCQNGTHGAFVRHKRSMLRMTGTEVAENAVTGLQVTTMGTAALSGCQFVGNGVSGVQSTDLDTAVTLEDCVLNHNGTIGVFVNKGADTRLTGCELAYNGSSGCEARDRHTRLRMAACNTSCNERVGVYSHSAASTDLAAVTVRKNGAKGILAGGRVGSDIGGGTVTYCSKCVIAGGTMVRHGGRILQAHEAEPAGADGTGAT